MDPLDEKSTVATADSPASAAPAARPGRKKKVVGLLLCLGAAAAAAAGWANARSGGEATDNAYLRGDLTSLAPKIAGYVTAVEVEDNQAVKAGDILFRIDAADYRAKLAQVLANVEAAQARVTNVDAETKLQHRFGQAGRSAEAGRHRRGDAGDALARAAPRADPQQCGEPGAAR